VFGLPNGLAHSRLGVTVTRRVGGAVVRNRAKRVLRDVFRRRRPCSRLPMDLVVNVRSSMPERPTRLIERELLRCCAELESKALR
jgi:ribonuclease P protein component